MASKYGHGSGDISSFYRAAQRVSCPNRPFVMVSRHSQLPVGLCRDPSPGGVMATPQIDPNDLGKRTGSCPDPVWAYCGRARMEVARGRTPCGVFRLLPAGRARGP